IQQKLTTKGIQNAVIGRVTSPDSGAWIINGSSRKPLEKPGLDPYWKAYWKASEEKWK
ncbi:MAG: synthase family protein, partial [Thermoproteota archaeon]|nr:synthase family protein [Thermoproteota archaeon]